MNAFQRLPEKLQGLLAVVAGVMMILYALGLVQKGINFVVILVAASLILFGYMKLGIHKKVMHLIHRK
jgi:hypothetical protein